MRLEVSGAPDILVALKLLYFAPHPLWPLTTGARLRDYHLAHQLSKHCAVTFLQTVNREDPEGIPSNAGFAQIATARKDRSYTPGKLVRGVIGPSPVTVLNYVSRQTEELLTHLLRTEQFDVVQLVSVHLASYLNLIRAAPSNPAILADFHNIESELMWRYGDSSNSIFKKMMARRTAQLLEGAEQRVMRTCSVVTVPSEREKQELRSRLPESHIAVIPNGVDTTYYSPEEVAKSGASGAVGGGLSRRLVVFVGSMDYHANIGAVEWFSREVWPDMAAQFPELDFAIVGRDPAAAVRRLASDRIHVTGTVDDVRPFYARAVAVVVPIRVGGGTRLKILEAMAAGVPVISTTAGVEGIEAEHDVHFLLADSGSQMRASVGRLTGSDETRSRLRDAARKLVVTRYDWAVIGARLFEIHASLVESRAG